jgi:hypothetical protein
LQLLLSVAPAAAAAAAAAAARTLGELRLFKHKQQYQEGYSLAGAYAVALLLQALDKLVSMLWGS